MFSKIAVRTLVAGIALISTSSSASTDPAIAAGLFLAAVAAVEDRCERYSSVVEAFAWDRFSDQEYSRVIEAARIHKPFVVALISNLFTPLPALQRRRSSFISSSLTHPAQGRGSPARGAKLGLRPRRSRRRPERANPKSAEVKAGDLWETQLTQTRLPLSVSLCHR